jgi:hypothetical protein
MTQSEPNLSQPNDALAQPNTKHKIFENKKTNSIQKTIIRPINKILR